MSWTGLFFITDTTLAGGVLLQGGRELLNGDRAKNLPVFDIINEMLGLIYRVSQ